MITEETKAEIRRLARVEKFTRKQLMEMFGLSKTTIGYVFAPRKSRDRFGAIERQSPSKEVPSETIAERDYRLSLRPRSLTAALMGDPPKGYSALDRVAS